MDGGFDLRAMIGRLCLPFESTDAWAPVPFQSFRTAYEPGPGVIRCAFEGSGIRDTLLEKAAPDGLDLLGDSMLEYVPGPGVEAFSVASPPASLRSTVL